MGDSEDFKLKKISVTTRDINEVCIRKMLVNYFRLERMSLAIRDIEESRIQKGFY